MPQDTRLQLSVLAELEWEPSITAAHIGVAANGGIVTLTGQVESYAQKHAAEAAARRVKGVLAVKVGVEAGWVTLKGEVDWNYQRKAAEQDVRRLHGVVGVSNQVSLKARVNTANISSDISCALHRSFFPDPDAITVTAEGGKVRLTGNVHSWHARQVADETAWGAPGAVDVENLLAVI
jgi:osmotically-inducible protein OsmY